MLTQAFYTGLSGLKSTSTAIDVTSNNIANANTVGYRGYSTEFSSLFEDMLRTSGNSNTPDNSVGMGTRVSAISMMSDDGALSVTDRSTDLAIYGDGWFGVAGNNDIAYTKAGDFTFDVNSDLVTSDGYHVMGTMGTNIDGELLTDTIDSIGLNDVNKQVPLNFPRSLTYPPEATTYAKFIGNIGSAENEITMGTSVIDANNNNNNLQLTYSKSDTQVPPGVQWDVNATVSSHDGNTIYDSQNGTIFFDESGAIKSTTLTQIDNNGTMVDIDLGEGFSGIVAVNSAELTASTVSNGAVGGELVGYAISDKAEVIATFTNGKQSSVGKIAVYHFQNEQGLERLSDNKFSTSSNSGDAIFFTDANGNNVIGTDIRNFQLETSNVKMEVALTELIIFQRSYDANSKTMTTADEMMKKALDMDA